jgi:hypothetical protein
MNGNPGVKLQAFLEELDFQAYSELLESHAPLISFHLPFIC